MTEEILSGSDVGTRIEGYNKVLDDDHKWKKFMFGIKDVSMVLWFQRSHCRNTPQSFSLPRETRMSSALSK